MSAAAKYTLGPWDIKKGLHGQVGELTVWAPFDPVPGNHQKVATLSNPHGNHEANARLIAAAPELLDALTALEVRFGHVKCIQIGAARAAIARATGAQS